MNDTNKPYQHYFTIKPCQLSKPFKEIPLPATDCCLLGTIERERKEQEEKKTYKVAFEYVLESKRKAYEAVRQAGGGNIEHGLKIMQAMWDLEKTIYKQEP